MTQLPLAEFEKQHGVEFVAKLGDGKDGLILQTNRHTAVKLFYDAEVYARELRAYRIMQVKGIEEILGHQVPQFQLHDDQLRAIEMSIVSPPLPA